MTFTLIMKKKKKEKIPVNSIQMIGESLDLNTIYLKLILTSRD